MNPANHLYNQFVVKLNEDIMNGIPTSFVFMVHHFAELLHPNFLQFVHNYGEFRNYNDLEDMYNGWSPEKNIVAALAILSVGGTIRMVFNCKDFCLVNNIAHVLRRSTTYLEWCFLTSFQNVYRTVYNAGNGIIFVDFQSCYTGMDINSELNKINNALNNLKQFGSLPDEEKSKGYNDVWKRNWNDINGPNLNILLDIFIDLGLCNSSSSPKIWQKEDQINWSENKQACSNYNDAGQWIRHPRKKFRRTLRKS